MTAAERATRALPEVEGAFASGAFFEDPHDVYRRLRETAPVYWSPFLGQWLVTSAELVEEVLGQPRIFSNFGFDSGYIARLDSGARAEVPTLEHHFNQRGLIQLDPPEHTRLRRALGPHFSAKAVAHLEPAIARAVESLLAPHPDALDVIENLAAPLPVRIIADLLGVDEEERHGFPRWSNDAVRFFGTPLPDAANARALDTDLREWRQLLQRLLRERAEMPRDDVLTAVAQLVETAAITLEEALFTCVHLLIAGHETTTNLIGNGIYCLLEHPEQLAAVVADPDLLPVAVEEVLRFEPPIQRIRRVAACTVELGDASIATGDPVIPVLAAANRDPQRFDDPETFDVRREQALSGSRHMSFGHGVHFCVGAPLARIEAPLAIAAVLERYPHAALPAGFAPEWRRTINMRGLRSLPIESRQAPVAA